MTVGGFNPAHAEASGSVIRNMLNRSPWTDGGAPEPVGVLMELRPDESPSNQTQMSVLEPGA